MKWGVRHNPALQKFMDDGNGGGRGCGVQYKKCPNCNYKKMYAVFFDWEAIFEQLEEWACPKCNYVIPFPCGYPRFMDKALTKRQGVIYYNKNKPYGQSNKKTKNISKNSIKELYPYL